MDTVIKVHEPDSSDNKARTKLYTAAIEVPEPLKTSMQGWVASCRCWGHQKQAVSEVSELAALKATKLKLRFSKGWVRCCECDVPCLQGRVRTTRTSFRVEGEGPGGGFRNRAEFNRVFAVTGAGRP